MKIAVVMSATASETSMSPSLMVEMSAVEAGSLTEYLSGMTIESVEEGGGRRERGYLGIWV